MQTNIFHATGKVPVLFIGVPEGVINPSVSKVNGKLFYQTSTENCISELPPGSWTELGWLDELTDDQKLFIVHYSISNEVYWFKDYETNEFRTIGEDSSLLSLMRSAGVLIENPLGASPCNPPYRGYCEDSCQGECWNRAEIDYEEWQELEAKCYSKYLVFIQN